jgi:hypothetical protein
MEMEIAMRKFSVTLEVPQACDCCGALLPEHPAGLSRGSYRLELPEGNYPTTCSLGDGVRITLARGRLRVELRQRRGDNRAWDLLPRYNPDAFARLQTDWRRETTEEGDWGWYCFTVDLPEFKPWYATWWAELRFVEVLPFKKDHMGRAIEAHNSARLNVKLETLE